MRADKRTLQPHHTYNGGAEPLMSRLRPCLSGLVPVVTWRVLRGVEGGTCAWSGPDQERPVCLACVGQNRAYKPTVKSSGGQRKSEGVVVPLIGGQHNAPGGKCPHFNHARGEGKREGMAGTARPDHPGGGFPALLEGEPSFGKVRRLQRGLWAAAKQSPGRRFHALYDRIHGGDVLWEAWDRVKLNRGAAGVDRVTLAYVENEYGMQRLRAELQAVLRAGAYCPAPATRVDIPKSNGGKRPQGIPSLRDRVAQQTGRLWENKRIMRYYLHRWPSARAMKGLREKVRAGTGRNRAGADVRDVIADLDPLLRGSTGTACTGCAVPSAIRRRH